MFDYKGLKFPDDPRLMGERMQQLISSGRYEREEQTGLPRFIKPDARVVELGGGIGLISGLTCKLGVSHMTTVEANPMLAAYIERLHGANDFTNTQVINAVALPHAQAQAAGASMPFYVTRPFWSSSLVEPKRKKYRITQVPVVSLEEILTRAEANTLICDIEGGEAQLFDGLDVASLRHIYLEMHTKKMGAEAVRHIFSHLHTAGFTYDETVSNGPVVLFSRL
ncbi:MAG: FkbM family methyltransferase [Pseudomonadota bacterium]